MSAPTKNRYRPWSDDDIRIAAEIWRRDHIDGRYGRQSAVCAAIAATLGRTIGSVLTRYQDYGPGFGGVRRVANGSRTGTPAEAQDVETERKLRHEARERMDLTATIFGDPPPGYSALDQRRGPAT